MRILAKLAGVKHEIHHNHTTVDAPETVRYIRSIPDVIIDYPELSMWQLIVKKGLPPTRTMRYCCSEFKERGGRGRVKVTGVRWAESNNRKVNGGVVKIIGKPNTVRKIGDELGAEFSESPAGGIILNTDNDENRRFVERCFRTTSTLVNPIIDWSDADVWEFLDHYGCESNPLYQCGKSRVGCVGCSLQSTKGMKKDFIRYPKYKEAYIRAFDRMLIARKERGKPHLDKLGNSGEEVMKWWLGGNIDQIEFDL